MIRAVSLIKRLVCALLAGVLALLAVFSAAPLAVAADDQVGRVTASGGASIYVSASSSSEIISSVPYGRMLIITGMVGNEWYAVTELSENPSFSGFAYASEIAFAPYTVSEAIFEEYLDAQNFPESYRPALRALHEEYPKWVFEAVHTGLSWSSVVANESKVGRNLVPRNSSKAYINTSDLDANGVQRGRDGYSWVAASTGIIQYYLDPRNFLNDYYIFMFESLSYSPSTHTRAGVETVLKNSFMYNKTFSAGGATHYYSDTFMAAAAASGVSPYHLASRVIQEQGYGGSPLAHGTVSGYAGYYNFFNINAYPSGGRSSVVNGARYAKTREWNSPYKSIVEGSSFIGNAYIKIGQDTIYFQKFDVVNASDGYYWHQYMTNVMAPASEAPKLKSAYKDNLNTDILFRIPVYTGMPATAVPKPTLNNKPTVKISSFRLEDGTISRITPSTTVRTLLSKVSVTGGTKSVIDAGGRAKSAGAAVATGDKILIYTADGTIYRSYAVVIYGDVNGDGQLSVLDLLEIQKHLTTATTLRDYEYEAGDVNKDGSITAADLLILYKYLLNLQKLSQ